MSNPIEMRDDGTIVFDPPAMEVDRLYPFRFMGQDMLAGRGEDDTLHVFSVTKAGKTRRFTTISGYRRQSQ